MAGLVGRAHHVRLYKNRPIFWLLSSAGRDREKGRARHPAFACFLAYHKLTGDTLPKVRGLYLAKAIERARIEAERVGRQAAEARLAKEERKATRLAKDAEAAREDLHELEVLDKALENLSKPRRKGAPLPADASWLEQKIAEIRDNGYAPDIDYGVLVNITPMKEAGILHPAAARVK